VIARCQQHPTENVKNRLPERLKSVVEKRMRKAYHAVSALAVAHLEALAKELERTHPVPAASLRRPARNADRAAPKGPAHAGPHAGAARTASSR
jgi:hypothetical protein